MPMRKGWYTSEYEITNTSSLYNTMEYFKLSSDALFSH